MLKKITPDPIYLDEQSGRFVLFQQAGQNYHATYVTSLDQARFFLATAGVRAMTGVDFWDAVLRQRPRPRPQCHRKIRRAPVAVG